MLSLEYLQGLSAGRSVLEKSDRIIEPSRSDGSTPGSLILSGNKVKASLLKTGGGYKKCL